MLISLGTQAVESELDEISTSVSVGSSIRPDLKCTRDVLNAFCASPHLILMALKGRFSPEEPRPRDARPTLSTCLFSLPVCLQDSSQTSTRSLPRATISRRGQELVDWCSNLLSWVAEEGASQRHVPHDFSDGPQ